MSLFPKVSFAITVKDELEEFDTLIGYLAQNLVAVGYDYELAVLRDGDTVDPIAEKVLRAFAGMSTRPDFEPVKHTVSAGIFDGDFAAWKNRLAGLCRGEYILQIDADEIPPEGVLRHLETILKMNPGVDLFCFPRLNVVQGIGRADVETWGWTVSRVPGCEADVVQWPDYQGRLYRRSPGIKWTRPIHEYIDGARQISYFPQDSRFALLHSKTIDRQRKQNELYRQLMSEKGANA